MGGSHSKAMPIPALLEHILSTELTSGYVRNSLYASVIPPLNILVIKNIIECALWHGIVWLGV
jgi:hypothetical protein